MLQTDPLVELVKSGRGFRGELIPFPILNARGVRKQGVLYLFGEQDGSVQEFMAAKCTW
jgi:hypothetical protein